MFLLSASALGANAQPAPARPPRTHVTRPATPKPVAVPVVAPPVAAPVVAPVVAPARYHALTDADGFPLVGNLGKGGTQVRSEGPSSGHAVSGVEQLRNAAHAPRQRMGRRP